MLKILLGIVLCLVGISIYAGLFLLVQYIPDDFAEHMQKRAVFITAICMFSTTMIPIIIPFVMNHYMNRRITEMENRMNSKNSS